MNQKSTVRQIKSSCVNSSNLCDFKSTRKKSYEKWMAHAQNSLFLSMSAEFFSRQILFQFDALFDFEYATIGCCCLFFSAVTGDDSHNSSVNSQGHWQILALLNVSHFFIHYLAPSTQMNGNNLHFHCYV